jgi:hypothetical protein
MRQHAGDAVGGVAARPRNPVYGLSAQRAYASIAYCERREPVSDKHVRGALELTPKIRQLHFALLQCSIRKQRRHPLN